MVVRKPTYKKWWLDFQGNAGFAIRIFDWNHAPPQRVENFTSFPQRLLQAPHRKLRRGNSGDFTVGPLEGGESQACRTWTLFWVYRGLNTTQLYGDIIYNLGGGNSNIFGIFTPNFGEDSPIWLIYFSDGLKPPTSIGSYDLIEWKLIGLMYNDSLFVLVE